MHGAHGEKTPRLINEAVIISQYVYVRGRIEYEFEPNPRFTLWDGTGNGIGAARRVLRKRLDHGVEQLVPDSKEVQFGALLCYLAAESSLVIVKRTLLIFM